MKSMSMNLGKNRRKKEKEKLANIHGSQAKPESAPEEQQQKAPEPLKGSGSSTT